MKVPPNFIGRRNRLGSLVGNTNILAKLETRNTAVNMFEDYSQAWWSLPVITAAWEAEARGMQVPRQPG